MKNLHICPSHLLDVATLPWKIQKVTFSSVFHVQFYVISEENKLPLLYCCLAVCLLLFSACYYLRGPITASGARYRRSASIEYQI